MKKKLFTMTNIIILICILVYVIDRFILVTDISPDLELDFVIAGKNIGTSEFFIKLLGLNFGKLYDFMALIVIDGKMMHFWQPLTYIFMHQFILHLIANLIILYIIGNKLEKDKGTYLTLFIFIITGIVGVLISNAIVISNSSSAGSSIAIFGLIGMALGICMTEKDYIKSFSKKSKIILAIYGLIFTYTSGTWTMVAHNVGLILGFLFYLIYYYIYKTKKLKGNN